MYISFVLCYVGAKLSDRIIFKLAVKINHLLYDNVIGLSLLTLERKQRAVKKVADL